MNWFRAALALMGGGLLSGCAELPVAPPAGVVIWLAQGWTAAQRQWFHHVSQGTATLHVPCGWFMALEQPELGGFDAPGLFSDAAYLRRWGGRWPSPTTCPPVLSALPTACWVSVPRRRPGPSWRLS